MPKPRKMTAEGVAVVLLRSLRGWNQTQLAQASGTDKSLLSRYERGRKLPGRQTLERLCTAAGVPFSLLEPLLPVIRRALALIEKTSAEQASPGLFVPSPVASEALAELGLLPKRQASSTPEQARREAEELWEYLATLPARDRRVLIEGAREYQSWALCERLCFASKSEAADDAGESVKTAELAVRVADLVPGEEAFRLSLQGYAWAHLANSRRVHGNHRSADEAFARSDAFLNSGDRGVSGLLNIAQLPDLKASLRRHQGRFAEALKLHEHALALARPENRGSYLINQAKTLEEMNCYEESIAKLKQAEPLLDVKREPRDQCVLKFNLVANLCHLHRYGEAEALLPEVRTLAAQLGTGLDAVRLRWLEGKVAAGLGRREEALAAFSQVRAEFTARGIAFDTALVSLELARVHLELGHTGEVKTLAREMVMIFESQEGHKEALAALRLFCRAAENEKVTLELVRQLLEYLHRARHDSRLRFESGRGPKTAEPSG